MKNLNFFIKFIEISIFFEKKEKYSFYLNKNNKIKKFLIFFIEILYKKNIFLFHNF